MHSAVASDGVLQLLGSFAERLSALAEPSARDLGAVLLFALFNKVLLTRRCRRGPPSSRLLFFVAPLAFACHRLLGRDFSGTCEAVWSGLDEAVATGPTAPSEFLFCERGI